MALQSHPGSPGGQLLNILPFLGISGQGSQIFPGWQFVFMPQQLIYMRSIEIYPQVTFHRSLGLRLGTDQNFFNPPGAAARVPASAADIHEEH